MRTRLCFPQGHCGSSSRLGSYSRKSPSSFPAEHSGDSRGWGRRGVCPVWPSVCSRLTCVQAALVAVGAAQTEAPVAGVTRLDEGRGGVYGVPPAPQHVGRIQELGVGDGLQMVKFSIKDVFVNMYVCLRSFPTLPHLSVSSQLHSFQPDHHLLGADPSRRMPLARSFQLYIPNKQNIFRDLPTTATLSRPNSPNNDHSCCCWEELQNQTGLWNTLKPHQQTKDSYLSKVGRC